MSCSIARPSSEPGSFPSCTTVTSGGRSPVATSSAAWIVQPKAVGVGAGQLSNVSDRAPTLIPLPVMPRACALSAFSSATAWLCTDPANFWGSCTAAMLFTAPDHSTDRVAHNGRNPSSRLGSSALVAVRLRDVFTQDPREFRTVSFEQVDQFVHPLRETGRLRERGSTDGERREQHEHRKPGGASPCLHTHSLGRFAARIMSSAVANVSRRRGTLSPDEIEEFVNVT